MPSVDLVHVILVVETTVMLILVLAGYTRRVP